MVEDSLTVSELVSKTKPSQNENRSLPEPELQHRLGAGNADYLAGRKLHALPEPAFLARIELPKQEIRGSVAGNNAADQDKKGHEGSDVKSEIKDTKSTQRDRLSYEGLVAIVDKTFINQTQKKEILDNLAKLKDRSGKNKVDQAELERFYNQVGRVCLASTQGNERFTSEEMRQVAMDFSLHGGNPGTVDQGKNPTCLFGALESVLYATEPSLIAGLVADVVINGQFITVDGTVVKPNNDCLHVNDLNRDNEDSARSLANRIAQVTLPNVYWNRQTSAAINGHDEQIEGKFSYEEGHPREYINDKGGRIIDHSTNPPRVLTVSVVPFDPTRLIPGPREKPQLLAPPSPVERPSTDTEVPDTALPDIYRQIGGQRDDFTIVSPTHSPSIRSPKTREEFKTLLEDAKAGRNGVRLPLVLIVDVTQGPLAQDRSLVFQTNQNNQEQRRKGSDVLHALAVFDLDSKTGLVTVQNQWGESRDHTGQPGSKPQLTLDEVWQAYERGCAPVDVQPENVEPGKPEKYIALQKQFIEELRADPRIKPEKILEERLKLHHYLDHWGFKQEADKLADELKNDCLKIISKPGELSAYRALNLASSVADILHKANKDEEIKPLLAATDALYKSEHAKLLAQPQNERQALENAYENLIELHIKYGDRDGIPKLHKELIASIPDTRTKVAMTEATVRLLNAEGGSASIPAILTAIDDEMRTSAFSDIGKAESDISAYRYLLSLHKQQKDQSGEKVIDNMLTGLQRLETKTTEEKIEHLNLAISAADMAISSGYPDKATAQLDSFMTAQREIEERSGLDTPAVTDNKCRLINLCLEIGKKTKAAKLAEELQTSYDRLNQKDLEQKDLAEIKQSLSSIRLTLQDAYEKLGDLGKVTKLIEDRLNKIENTIDYGDKKKGPDHVDLLGPLRGAADFYERTSQPEKAVQMLERGLSIALKNKDREGQVERRRFRLKLADVYKKMGQREKADKILKEIKQE